MPENLTYSELVKLVYELESKLENTIIFYTEKIQKLEKENAELKAELAHYKNPKNSRNSSVPPSKDENRPKRNQSLRKKTNRKPGGQIGHTGTTLKMTSNPDIITEITPDYCNHCGSDLSEISKEFVGRRQVIDIPPIKTVVTEYQVFSKRCTCGCRTKGSYPIGVDSAVSYGNNVQGLIAYLHTRQYIPSKRMKELLNQLFSLPISEGGIDHLLNKYTIKTERVYQLIKAEIPKCKVIGGDETGCKVNGKNHWFWTLQNHSNTLIIASDNRAQKTIESLYPKGFPNSYFVSDCWKPQLNTPAKQHQICTAHLLRELEYLKQNTNNNLPENFQQLLLDAIKLKEQMKIPDYTDPKFEPREKIIQRFDKILQQSLEFMECKIQNTFFKRIARLKDSVFVFLFQPEVPPDNNGSERAIRNVKVKLKISGQFKSEEGAERYAVIRSVIDTLIKKGLNLWDAIITIANFEPQLN